jgi:protein phosphatase
MSTRLYSTRPWIAEDPFPSDVGERGPRRAIAVDAGAWSRKGASRPVNEDYFASASLAATRRHPGAPLFLAVADGMGGEAAGQRASRVATHSMLDSLGSLSRRRLESEPEEALRFALVRAHLDVLEDGNEDVRRNGMGTTLTAALVVWPKAYVIHSGDSRAYRVRRGVLDLLTSDHTVAELLVARGQLSPEEARASRYRHILWNHLGGDTRMPDPQALSLDLQPGDGLLLATDGLIAGLDESELAEIATRPVSAYAVCHMLVERAAGAGTRDDATAMFARFGLP